MARKPKIEYKGAFYRVITRGTRKDPEIKRAVSTVHKYTKRAATVRLDAALFNSINETKTLFFFNVE